MQQKKDEFVSNGMQAQVFIPVQTAYFTIRCYLTLKWKSKIKKK